MLTSKIQKKTLGKILFVESVETIFNCNWKHPFFPICVPNHLNLPSFTIDLGPQNLGPSHDEPAMGNFSHSLLPIVPAESYPSDTKVSDFGRPIHLCHFASEMFETKNLEVDRFKKALQGG